MIRYIPTTWLYLMDNEQNPEVRLSSFIPLEEMIANYAPQADVTGDAMKY